MARWGKFVSLVAALALVGTACGAGDNASSTAATSAAVAATSKSAAVAATSTASQSSAEAEACSEYTVVVAGIGSLASEAIDAAIPVFGALSDEDTLLALLFDVELLDSLIDVFEDYSDGFNAFQQSVPTAPPGWATLDRHLRNALSAYTSAFASISSAFRLFKAGDIEAATAHIVNAAGDIDGATSELDLGTDAIPPGGC
jgi:hypothetical protein